ncbi:MAG: GtrA family protein [Candidatus Saccharibacteria bacterium]|nr:GtrA family protein [Candidatus Saccharibacteria bacterium]
MQEKLKKLSNHELVKKHGEKIRFLLVGGFNTVLDFVIFGTLANVLGLDKVISNIISTAICIAISFVLNFKFVWKSEKSIKSTATGFLIVSLFSAWVVQSAVITVVSAALGNSAFAKLAAKACGSVTGMITNYFGYKFIFKKPEEKSTSRQK